MRWPAPAAIEHDVAVMRAIAASTSISRCSDASQQASAASASDLGELAEGIVGPSQWEESIEIAPALGPTPARVRAADARRRRHRFSRLSRRANLRRRSAHRRRDCERRPLRRRDASRGVLRLRTTTMFGDFSIDRVTGRQLGHQMLLVQWHRGRKVIIVPESHDDSRVRSIFPSGWRLLLAGVEMLRFGSSRRLRRKSPTNMTIRTWIKDERNQDYDSQRGKVSRPSA